MARSLTGTELLRQSIHIATGFLALSLRWIDPLAILPLAIGGLVLNVWILPKVGGRNLWRPAEREKGFSLGMVAYPIAVMAQLLFCHQQLFLRLLQKTHPCYFQMQ